jgi:HEAT repeat protein
MRATSCRFVRSATILALLTAALLAESAAAADIKQLVHTLTTGDPAAQQSAADALADLGEGAREAVPALIQAAASSDAGTRWRAARALGVIGDLQAAAALRDLTADGDVLVRSQAIFALGRLKAADERSLEIIVDRLSDQDAQVRRAAIRALRLVDAPRGMMVPLIVKLLSDSDQAVAMRALSAIGDGGIEVLPSLIAALDDRDARYWALLAVGEMGPQAGTAVPALVKALGDDRPEVRLQAAIALGEIGPDAKSAVGAITKLLDDPLTPVRSAATFALGKIGDTAASPALVKAEQAEEPFVKVLATWALAKLHPSDEQRAAKAIELLVQTLADKNRETSQLAAKALEDLRPGTELLRPTVDKLLGSKPEVAERVLAAYSSLGGGAVPHATSGLSDPQRRVRSLQILARIGPEAVSAVPPLVELLKSGDAATKTEVLYTLGAIGPGAGAAAGPIAEQLADNDPRVAQAAAIALGKLGPDAKEAIPALAKLQQSQDELLRLVSVWAILRIGPPSAELTQAALPILTAALKNQREFVRVEAATALGELGQGAANALPMLEAAGKDASPAVRSAVASAIEKIQR